MLSRIYLIRHGKTDGNRNHWYYGSTDLSLTEEGVKELRAYAAQGIYPELPDDAEFYTTGLTRTDETLEAIYGKREHTAIPKLQEIGFGKAECMTYDELKKFDNFEKWSWDTTGSERICDDAETANEFHERIYEGLKELLGKHRLKEWSHRHGGQDAVSVVVCHGGVIACIMEKLFPAVCGSMWDWLPEPGFGYAVDFRDSDPYMYSKINDIGRLGLGIYRLPLRKRAQSGGDHLKTDTVPKERQIDHKKTRALVDTLMNKGHGYFELEFLAPPGCTENKPREARGGVAPYTGLEAATRCEDQVMACEEPGLHRKYKAVRDDLVARFDRSRYYLTALVDASMLDRLEDMIKETSAGYLDRVAVCGTERYYEDYPEDAELEPETLADKRIAGPEEDSGRPVKAELEAVWKKLAGLKADGLIKKAGLAFCGSATLLDDLLKDRPEIDYVELPVNYRMGFSEGGLAQKYYTISRRRYKEILVRSPFAGGELAILPEAAFGSEQSSESHILNEEKNERGRGEADEQSRTDILRRSMAGYALLKKDRAPKSAVDWALRYVLSFPFVVTCVVSTSDPAHAAEDMEAAERFRPLTEEDREKLKRAFLSLSRRDDGDPAEEEE